MLIARTHRRAPGIRFEVPEGQPASAIPRMDIAAFVGFASSGPIGIPVAVEDAEHFRAVFGEDLRLAWDASDQDWAYAYLGPAVRDFFANGGKRCWIVRVANAQAVSNTFELPGVMTVAANGTLSPAVMSARSEGSWSDLLRTGTALQVRPIAISDARTNVGDLVRFTLSDGSGAYFGFVTGAGSYAPSYWLATEANVAVPASIPVVLPAFTAAVLTFELRVRAGDVVFRAEDLGFSPQHPNYWGKLPSDIERFVNGDKTPLFPLSGGSKGYTLPAGMKELLEYIGGPKPSVNDPLVRDGVTPFDASLFLDPKVGQSGLFSLLSDADFLRYQSPSPRRLQGMHALLELEEPSLIAVPDAVHYGWTPRSVPPAAAGMAATPQPKPKHDQFLQCRIRELNAPTLEAKFDKDGNIELTLTVTDGNRFVVEESIRPDFATSTVISDGADVKRTVYGRAQGDYYYRAQASDGLNRSDWSAPAVMRVGSVAGFQVADQPDPRVLPQVQRALLRMCAAKGDWFAVLSAPYGSRWEDVNEYVRVLPVPGEEAALSYGAIYHSWLVSRDEVRKGGLRTTPPDGAIAGMMAKRSSERGPWIAPANVPLSNVLTTDPLMRMTDRPDWFDIPVNWIFLEPSGFLTMSAETLSEDEDLQPINVRRLLSVLRRMALERGQTLVFEPNDAALRRSVVAEFSEMMSDLYRRGAFAGRSPERSFQVVASSSNNPPQSVEQGRLIVELRVAPSLPLKFLTVRLLQSDDRRLLLEGR